jgi:cytochrome c oxidase subunit 2
MATIGAVVLGLLVPLPAFAQAPSPLTPGSETAGSVASLFWVVLGIAAVVFVIVEGLLIYAVLRYRRRFPDDMPEQVEGNARLELIWTVVPALIMVVLFGLTLRQLQRERNAPADAIVVEVTGNQWYWQFKYPDTQLTLLSSADDLVLPAGRPVLLEVRSNDVIHSFWVPELSGKMDAIPGHTNTIWFEAEPGTYAGQCAEYCGLEHYAMLFDVLVLPPDEFAAWMDEQVLLASQFQPVGTDLTTPLPAGDAGRGAALFSSLGCAACHSLDGTRIVGPSIKGIGQAAGARIAGYSAEQYLRESIVLPCDYIVEGFTCVMPQDFGQRLEAQDLADLIAYLLEQ